MGFKHLFCLFSLCACSLFSRPLYQQPWGNDTELLRPARTAPPTPRSLGTRIAEAIIDFHQKVISPVDGPRSHFRPTSSQYMRLAMHRYGFFKGFLMGCDRLLRENDEAWVYRTIEIDGVTYKFDPALQDKYGPLPIR
jgi:putative component of membrane protein insertase Oxa1/YidC/SpoIIIJ protein YidD